MANIYCANGVPRKYVSHELDSDLVIYNSIVVQCGQMEIKICNAICKSLTRIEKHLLKI